jgi:type I restriction enzyme S subunit
MSFPRYPAYKPRGVEWLGEVPEHWEEKRIRFLLKSSNEGMKIGPFGSALTSEMLSDDGAYKVYGQENIISRDFSIGTRRICQAKFSELSAYQVQARDVLVTMMGTSGRCDVVPIGIEPGIMDSHLLRMRLEEDRYCIFLKWLIDEAEYVRIQVRLAGKGSIMHGLNSGIIKDLLLVLPPLCEQGSILEFLDHETAKIDALIAEQQRLIELLQEKRQAVISHAVTKGLNPNAPMKDSGVEWLGEVPEHWEVIQLKWLTPVKRGASPRPIDDPIYFDEQGEYAWVRISDVTVSSGRLKDTTQRLSVLGSDLSVKLEPGALFVSIAGSVGKPCISEIKACIHDGFVYFPLLPLSPEYLMLIFESGACFGGLGKLGTQLNLNTDTIGSIYIAVPPEADEIERIIHHCSSQVGELHKLSESVISAISLLQERRSALISAAVTGKIDVRGLVPENETA